MKIDSYLTSPHKQKCVTFRCNAYELEILKGLVLQASRNTPIIPDTTHLRRDYRNILKAFNKVDLEKLKEFGAEHRQ